MPDTNERQAAHAKLQAEAGEAQMRTLSSADHAPGVCERCGWDPEEDGTVEWAPIFDGWYACGYCGHRQMLAADQEDTDG